MSEIVTLSLNLDLSIWCSRAHSVARLRRMPMLISNIFWRFAIYLPSAELIRIWYGFVSFCSHYWGRQSNCSTQIGRLYQSRRNAPMHFSPSSFHWVKPIPFRIRSRAFNTLQTRSSSRCGNSIRTISLRARTTGWKSGSSSKATIMG
jgi:hypothetical protein